MDNDWQCCTRQPDAGLRTSRQQRHSKSTDDVKVTINVRPNLDINLILDKGRVWTLKELKHCTPVVYKPYIVCSQ